MHTAHIHRSLYLFEATLFILMGILAIAIPNLFTYSIELIIGILFLVGGLVKGIRTLKAGQTAGVTCSVLTSLLAIAVGVLLLAYPLTGMLTLTLILAAFFFVDGIINVALSFCVRPQKSWGWLLFSGIASIMLACIIWSGLPGSAGWVIGLIVGINLLLVGFSLLFLTLGTSNVDF